MLVAVILIIFILPLIYFISINSKIKYTFWFFGILYWNNPYFFSIATSQFKPSMDIFFLIVGLSVLFIPLFFIVSSIQTIISVFLQRDYIKLLIPICLIIFTLLYYKDVMDVRIITFDWIKFILRTIIIIGTIFLFFKKETIQATQENLSESLYKQK